MIRSLARRSSIYFSGLLAGKILSFFVFILYARALLPEVFGQFILFITIIQLLTFFADFGLVQWYQKQAQKEKASALFTRITQTRVLTLVISLILASVFLAITHSFSPLVSFFLVLTMVFEAFLSISDGYYLEKHNAFIVSLKTIGRMAILLLSYIIFQPHTLSVTTFIYFYSTVIVCVGYFPWTALGKTKTVVNELISTLRSSSTYGTLIFTSFAYSRGDSLLIRYLVNSAALGIYAAAYRFLESISLLPTALTHTLFPVAAKEEGITQKQTISLTLIFFFIGLSLAILLFFSSEILILTLLGIEYSEAIPILKIFSCAVLFFFTNAPLSTVIQSSKIVQSFLPFGITNTVLNLVLNIMLIPFYGITAAAWIMVFTELSGFLINIYFIQKLYAQR